MNKNKEQFVKFIVAGGIAASVNFFSRFIFGFYLDYASSIVSAYLVGMVTAYLICRAFIFEAGSNNTLQQISYFTLVNIFAVLQTLIVSLIFANYFFRSIEVVAIREALSHFIGICVPVFTSFVGHKYVTFR